MYDSQCVCVFVSLPLSLSLSLLLSFPFLFSQKRLVAPALEIQDVSVVKPLPTGLSVYDGAPPRQKNLAAVGAEARRR